jgi:hypothetical protein
MTTQDEIDEMGDIAAALLVHTEECSGDARILGNVQARDLAKLCHWVLMILDEIEPEAREKSNNVPLICEKELTGCTLKDPELLQCCCNCVNLRAVHYHCGTTPKPEGGKGCVCGVQMGWACAIPGRDRIYHNWPQHSGGCELYTARTPNASGQGCEASPAPDCSEALKGIRTAKKLAKRRKSMMSKFVHQKLYYHETSGRAEYLTDKCITNPDGSKEGTFENAKIVVRIDGDIREDAEIRMAKDCFYCSSEQFKQQIGELLRQSDNLEMFLQRLTALLKGQTP